MNLKIEIYYLPINNFQLDFVKINVYIFTLKFINFK